MSTATTRSRLKIKLDPDAATDALARYFVGTKTDEGEQRMFCPDCEDPDTSRTPSASVNVEDGVWNCLKGNHGGSTIDIVRKLGGKATLSKRADRVRPKQSRQEPLEGQDKPLDWHDRLILHSPDQVAWANDQRGVQTPTLARAFVGFDGQHWTFPVRQATKWLQVKFIGYNAAGEKVKPYQTPGARAQLWPAQFLKDAPTLPVLLCEGEWDALLAEQESAGLYVAVTGTGGAGTPPADLSLLANREVFIAYDLDLAGDGGAVKVAEKLRSVGARVYIVNLRRFGMQWTEAHGEDISDFFRKFGGTAEKLHAEFERLREAGETEGPDDVLRAIEALFMAEEDARRTLNEVRSDDDILDMPPARYVIDAWLPVGFYSDFFGEPGSKKTFVLLDMLRHIRAGKSWHGHDVTRGATLLFEGEGLEQLQTRIVAWNEYHEHPEMAPGGAVSTPIDITTPEGVARVARTVRDFEAKNNTTVVAVGFDPVVEYMNGEENGEGMELVTRGFRALARYLDIAVALGAHTNAAGERARGGDQLRMRAGAHVRVETLKGDRVGIVQEKQKNGERRALQLLPVSVGSSLVLQKLQAMTATEYYADKSNTDFQEKAATKLKVSQTGAVVRHSEADRLSIDYVRAHPGVGKGTLVNACIGQGVGKPTLEVRIDALVSDGALRFDKDGPARNAATHYFVIDNGNTTEEVE